MLARALARLGKRIAHNDIFSLNGRLTGSPTTQERGSTTGTPEALRKPY